MSKDAFQPDSFRISTLFSDLVDGLVSAQKSLDQNTLEQRERFLLGPQGTLHVPPLWFHFRRVKVDLEVRALTVEKQGSPSLTCRLIDPVTSNLIETDVASRGRISVAIEPLTKLSSAATGEGNDE